MEIIINTTILSVAEKLIETNQMLAVAESCTGGWLAKVCTDLPGSSNWFDRGFVTYSNEAKQEMLGVPKSVIAEFGAVSEQTVEAMVRGVLSNSHAHWSISISGVAGPDGESDINPVGSVWFGWMHKGQNPTTIKKHFTGDRDRVRQQSVEFALEELVKLLI